MTKIKTGLALERWDGGQGLAGKNMRELSRVTEIRCIYWEECEFYGFIQLLQLNQTPHIRFLYFSLVSFTHVVGHNTALTQLLTFFTLCALRDSISVHLSAYKFISVCTYRYTQVYAYPPSVTSQLCVHTSVCLGPRLDVHTCHEQWR